MKNASAANMSRKSLFYGLSASALIKDMVAYIIASGLYAMSVDIFTASNDIAPGGVTGIATMINYFYGNIPIGTMMLIINVPLFILGGCIIGWRYILRTLVCLGLASGAIDLLGVVMPVYSGDRLLASIFGGLLMGLAMAVFFMRGGSTGGTDIVARMFGKLFPQITQGRLILFTDLVVLIAAVAVYGLEGGLYSLISLFVSSFTLDKVLYGTANGKMLFIISGKAEEINKAINGELVRGTTLLEAKGGYSGGNREVIMCAVRSSEAYKIRNIVRRIDEKAFIIIGTATEILGQGFKPLNENEFGEEE